MSGSALTHDRSVTSHLRPVNLQIWIQDSAEWDSLGHYVWNVGLSDYAGNIVYDWKRTPMGESRKVNEQGAIIFPRVMVDPRGGALTLVAMKAVSEGEMKQGVNAPGPFLMLQTARFPAVQGSRLLFQVQPTRSAETRTENDPTNKVTGSAKVGADAKIFSGEVGGSYEHGFAAGSTSDSHQGPLTGFTLVWVQK